MPCDALGGEQAVLTSALKYRAEQRTALSVSVPSADPMGPVRAWTFSDSARALLRKHLQDIAGVLQATVGVRALEKSRVNLYQSLHRAGGFFLQDYSDHFSFVESLPTYAAATSSSFFYPLALVPRSHTRCLSFVCGV
jgi:hypothetical protein